ncbi:MULTISPECIES: LmbU family transcriptional regulator [unclassified Streptomyces]|uniref:LmbU family transcriptional regulator n=1 Tax=unclassified Streptomyces TaxID=2593676 RepID=UPI0038049CD4
MHPMAASTPRRAAGLRRAADGAASLPAIARLHLDGSARALPTALQLPRDLPLAAWLRLGGQLQSAADSSSWWLGDWLVHGSVSYPNRYREAMRSTALDYQTLRNYAWVARKFPPSRRRQELSFQHHQEVAALPPEQQDLWLDRSAEHRWPKAELRRRLRAEAPGRAVPADRTARLSLEVAEERWEQWRRAAERERRDVGEWLAALADRAAREGT